MTGRKKLDALISGFKKLDEDRKDSIRELTRKLADIHGGAEAKKSKKKETRTGNKKQ